MIRQVEEHATLLILESDPRKILRVVRDARTTTEI
jgi:hypothetical protein